MNKIILSAIFFFFGLYPVLEAKSDDIPQPVEWESPLPKVADLNLDYNAMADLIGEDGMFTFLRDPEPITTWTPKGVTTYPNGYVVANFKVIHEPLEKVRNIIKDYSLIDKIQPQHTKVKFVSKKENHTLYSYLQVYNLSVIKLKSDFLAQQTLEDDGSISVMIHEGDVDAQVWRWEFVALDENKTMVVLSSWCAYSTARWAFKFALAVLPESHLIFTVAFSMMYLKQYSDYIEKDWLAGRDFDPDESSINPELVIPSLTKELSAQNRELIESLLTRGKVYIRTYQSAVVQGKEMKDLILFSVYDKINVPVEFAEPLIADITNLSESVHAIKKMKLREDLNEKCYQQTARFGKFPVIMPASVVLKFSEVKENRITWENPGVEGDFSPYSGAYEWSKMNSNKDVTFFTSTLTLRPGPNANFLVNLFFKIMPDPDGMVLSSVGVPAPVEARRKWIEKTYRESITKK